MTNEDHSHSATNRDLFREKVATACRQTGHQQKELADALGINAQVLIEERSETFNHGHQSGGLVPVRGA